MRVRACACSFKVAHYAPSWTSNKYRIRTLWGGGSVEKVRVAAQPKRRFEEHGKGGWLVGWLVGYLSLVVDNELVVAHAGFRSLVFPHGNAQPSVSASAPPPTV